MILHINLMEQRMHLSRMDLRQKRPREEEAEQPNSAASRPRVAEMFKAGEELVNECSSYPGPSVQHDSSSDHTASLRDESDTAGNLVNYEHALGQLSSLGGGFGHRGGTSRWYSSESAAQISDYSPKLKRPEGDGLEERRSLSNLFARPRDESDVHMNISARTLRPSGGKDRHSKVFTAKGPRDRRVRLSVSTAIQFYDVQDRLGYDQPSKAVEWLMKKAKNAIDELSQIPLPGLDRIPSFQQHHNAFGYSLASTSAESVAQQQQEQQPSWTPAMLRGLASNSEEAAVDLKCHQQQQMNENDRLELVRRASEQQHDIIGVSALGDPSRDFPCRGRSQQQEQQQQQQVPFSLQSPNSSHQREWRSLLHSFPGGGCNAATAAFHHHQHHSQQQQEDERTQHLHVRAEERPIPAAAPGFFQAPLPLPTTTTTTTTTPSLQYHHHHHHHQQTSLVTVQQTYLQPSLQQLEFVARPPSFAFQAPGLPFTHHVKDARSKTLPSAAGVDTTPQAGPPRLLLNTFNNNNNSNSQLSAGDATTSLHFSGQQQEDQASSGSSSRARKLGPS